MTERPPKPPARPEKTTLWQYLRLFRQDILSAQPARLYRAWMAEFKTPFFRSYLINQPELVKTVLKDRPGDFPKSGRVSGEAPGYRWINLYANGRFDSDVRRVTFCAS